MELCKAGGCAYLHFQEDDLRSSRHGFSEVPGPAHMLGSNGDLQGWCLPSGFLLCVALVARRTAQFWLVMLSVRSARRVHAVLADAGSGRADPLLQGHRSRSGVGASESCLCKCHLLVMDKFMPVGCKIWVHRLFPDTKSYQSLFTEINKKK